jgi:hypothetical protein
MNWYSTCSKEMNEENELLLWLIAVTGHLPLQYEARLGLGML